MLSRLTLSRALIVLAAVVPVTAASAEDRCTGTLCDFYYGGSPAPEPAKPAQPAPSATKAATAIGQIPEGATPLMVPGFLAPKQAATNGQAGTAGPDTSRVRVEGGGLIGMMNGTAPERCTGTICDLFYGGPPPEKPAAQPAGANALASDAAEPGEPPMPMVDNVRRAPPSCAAKGRDPWSCYR